MVLTPERGSWQRQPTVYFVTKIDKPLPFILSAQSLEAASRALKLPRWACEILGQGFGNQITRLPFDSGFATGGR